MMKHLNQHCHATGEISWIMTDTKSTEKRELFHSMVLMTSTYIPKKSGTHNEVSLAPTLPEATKFTKSPSLIAERTMSIMRYSIDVYTCLPAEKTFLHNGRSPGGQPASQALYPGDSSRSGGLKKTFPLPRSLLLTASTLSSPVSQPPFR